MAVAHDHAGEDVRGVCRRAAVAGLVLAVLFSQSKWLEYCFLPLRGDLQVTPVIAIAPLLLIYLPQQLAVVTWRRHRGVSFRVLANATLGSTRPTATWSGCLRSLMPRAGDLALSTLAGGAAAIMGGLRIAGRVSLIGAWSPRSPRAPAGSGSGLALPHCGIRLPAQHSAHVAALLLLSIAALSFIWRLRWSRILCCGAGTKSALGKDM